MPKKTFQAILERPAGVGTWTYLTVPFNALEVFERKGQIKVTGTINGQPYRSSLMPRGDGAHYLVVNKTLRDQIGAAQGDPVRVTMAPDSAPRAVALPADFKQALRRERAAATTFARFSYSHQKEYVDWIESAKKAETRARRIEAALEMIVKGGRLKG